jgi:hypothetical protein
VRPRTGGVAERRGNGLQSRVHGFKSRLHLYVCESRAISSVGERYLDTVEVTGSIPVSPTTVCAGQRPCPPWRGWGLMPFLEISWRSSSVERYRPPPPCPFPGHAP